MELTKKYGGRIRLYDQVRRFDQAIELSEHGKSLPFNEFEKTVNELNAAFALGVKKSSETGDYRAKGFEAEKFDIRSGTLRYLP